MFFFKDVDGKKASLLRSKPLRARRGHRGHRALRAAGGSHASPGLVPSLGGGTRGGDPPGGAAAASQVVGLRPALFGGVECHGHSGG